MTTTTRRHWRNVTEAIRGDALVGDAVSLFHWGMRPDTIGRILWRDETSLVVADGNVVQTIGESDVVGTTVIAASAEESDVAQAFERLMGHLGAWDSLAQNTPERMAREG